MNGLPFFLSIGIQYEGRLIGELNINLYSWILNQVQDDDSS